MKETYSERTILLKLKQMEKIQIKTMEILHRIEKLLDLEEDMEEEMEQKKPFKINHPFIIILINDELLLHNDIECFCHMDDIGIL